MKKEENTIKQKKKEKEKNNYEKIIFNIYFIFSFQSNVFAEENCKDLPGFKKLGKGSVE